MRYGCKNLTRAGAIVAFLIGGLAWSVFAHAEDGINTAPAAPAYEQPVHLPAAKTGGLRRGEVILITEAGAERMKTLTLAQRPAPKLMALSDICNTH